MKVTFADAGSPTRRGRNQKMADLLLEIRNLKQYFPIRGGIFHRTIGYVRAVDGVSFFLKRGESLGLVGESGCGKSTTARAILRLIEPTEGTILFEGRNVCQLTNKELRNLRRDMQIIFQDPYASLDPRRSVGQTIGEPLDIFAVSSNKTEKKERIAYLLEKVGLQPEHAWRYPHEFSGGQIQRIGIARALVLNPDLIVCDEPVSALDVSIQAQILNLFKMLQRKLILTYVFISHEMSVIRHVSDRIAVMYLGQIVEMANKKDLFNETLHPYSIALMSAIPTPNPFVKRKRIILKGELPNPIDTPPGCTFQTRCSYVKSVCKEQRPILQEIKKDHFVACHLFSGKD